MKNSNYIFLGISISYIVLAIIQWKSSGLLPISVYIAIAEVSLSLTIFELIIALVEKALSSQNDVIHVTKEEIALCERQIAIYSKFRGLESQIDEINAFRKRLLCSEQRYKNDRTVKNMVTIRNAITIFEIIIVCITLITTPLKVIPNDLFNNKYLSIMSLISFAFLFFSYFIKSVSSVKPMLYDNLEVSNAVSSYYLDIMDKVAPREDDK